MGVDAKCVDPFDFEKDAEAAEWALDADIHVGAYTHPRPISTARKSFKQSLTKPWRVVFPVHGTPELIFEQTVESAKGNGYGTGRSYAGHQIGMQDADAIVTFWPRHRDLYDLATDKHTFVDCLPMAVDAAFWQAGVSAGKYAGDPSFFSCENQYAFKWAYEILRVWRLILLEAGRKLRRCTSRTCPRISCGTWTRSRCGTAHCNMHGSARGGWTRRTFATSSSRSTTTSVRCGMAISTGRAWKRRPLAPK